MADEDTSPTCSALKNCVSCNSLSLEGSISSNLNNGVVIYSNGLVKKIPSSPPNGYTTTPVKGLSHLPKRPPVDIEFSDLSYAVAEGRTGYKSILKCVTGKFHFGELVAIMGPSGAGKTTLMNILAGFRLSNMSGEVLVNGKPRNISRYRKMSCYIMQDDCLLPHITVQESMIVSANLKLGSEVSATDKDVVVREILETLGLMECRNTRTEHLSGGQKKRLCIALELVNNPPVMLFDEPTSGLDSSSSLQCISLLKSLAEGGRTIVCTIHQPSARLFEMFDQLLMLAEGQCIYQGSTTGLVPFLSSMGLECPPYHNPADFVIEIASGDYGAHIHKLVTAVNIGKCNSWKKQDSPCLELDTVKDKSLVSSDGTETQVTMNVTTALLDSKESVDYLPGFPTSFWVQFYILLKRTCLSIMRDMTLTQLRFVSHILVGILIGLLYFGIGNEASKIYSNAGCLFFSMIFVKYTALMPTIMTFPMERTVFIREHFNHWYSFKAYYFAKTIADLPFQIIFPVIYSIIIYYMTGQPNEIWRCAMFTAMCVLVSLVAQSLGLLFGAAFEVENAVFLGPVTGIPVLLFSGFFVNFGTIPSYMRWLTYTSYLRYGFEGSLIAIYGFDRESLHCSEAYCLFKSPKKFLDEMDVLGISYWMDLGGLIIYFLILRVLCYVVFRWKIRSQR